LSPRNPCKAEPDTGSAQRNRHEAWTVGSLPGRALSTHPAGAVARLSGPIRKPPHSQLGFTLLALLFLIAVLGAQLALLGTLWSTAVKREKEAELLFVGDQFRLAIQSFYLRSPGQKRYPRSLEELLHDPRFPQTVRHLRRIYRDPVTGKAEWGLVQSPDGGVMGVHSLSPDKPMKTGNFPLAYEDFTGKQSYQEWVFLYGETGATQATAGPPASPQSPVPDRDR
jgi:type II secretory pathway pseudopilin PulG